MRPIWPYVESLSSWGLLRCNSVLRMRTGEQSTWKKRIHIREGESARSNCWDCGLGCCSNVGEVIVSVIVLVVEVILFLAVFHGGRFFCFCGWLGWVLSFFSVSLHTVSSSFKVASHFHLFQKLFGEFFFPIFSWLFWVSLWMLLEPLPEWVLLPFRIYFFLLHFPLVALF